MSDDTRAADLRYPIGRFHHTANPSSDDIQTWIADIAALPLQLRQAVIPLDDEQLATPYRDGGWTVRQVVHHLADSHINSYVRFRLALTEERPTIKPYDEAAWALLPDAHSGPVELSLLLIDALHSRWVALLTSLSADRLRRSILHLEAGELEVRTMIAIYSWHSRHHLAHIAGLKQRMGW